MIWNDIIWNKQDWKVFQSLAANISVKLVQIAMKFCHVVFLLQIPKLVLRIPIVTSNTNCYYKYQLLL
jgi:hypothetical protein